MLMMAMIVAGILLTVFVFVRRDIFHKGVQDKKNASILVNYNEYTLSRRTWWTSFFIAGAASSFIAYQFYHHPLVAGLCFGIGAWFPRIRRSMLLNKRRQALRVQFKQALYSLSSSLAAGRSVENAFVEAVQDLQLLYAEGTCDLIRELRIIQYRLENGEAIERAVQDFSTRACIDDITQFADVLSTCKRTGGDLVEVVRRTSHMIGEKLAIQQEISVMISQKKLEAKIMMIAPIGFLVFLNLTAPDFMRQLYSGIGIFVSTCALAGLLLTCRWIMSIMNIRV